MAKATLAFNFAAGTVITVRRHATQQPLLEKNFVVNVAFRSHAQI